METENHTWTRLQKKGAIVISSISFVAIVSHLLFPSLMIDEISIILLGIGLLPWFSLYFKKVSIPGIGEAETHDYKSSFTEKPVPPKTPANSIKEERQLKNIQSTDPLAMLSLSSKKILATLWKYQKLHFKDDISKRWTFAAFPHSPVYAEYLSGVSELIKLGFVSVNQTNNQIMLTNDGIGFIDKTEELKNYSDVYNF